MHSGDISKWELTYYWFLTGITEIKRFFNRFTKKGRQELAYENMRLNQIRKKIRNNNRKK